MVLQERQGLRYANRDFQFPVWDSRRLRRCLVAEFNLEIKGLPKMISFGLMRSFVITEFYCRTNFLSSPKRKDLANRHDFLRFCDYNFSVKIPYSTDSDSNNYSQI